MTLVTLRFLVSWGCTAMYEAFTRLIGISFRSGRPQFIRVSHRIFQLTRYRFSSYKERQTELGNSNHIQSNDCSLGVPALCHN